MSQFQKKDLKEKQFTYELLLSNCQKQQKMCWAIAIDHNSKFLVISAESNFNIFQFKEGAMKKIQIIQKHKSWITTLNFFQQMNYIISGSNCIQMWSKILQQNPKFLQKLSEHSLNIQCLVVSCLNQPLIISGSKDNSIKFWYQKDGQFICQQTIADHSNTVSGLSLNQEGNTLISCGEDNQILIIIKAQYNEWKVAQKIQGHGVRLSFISKNTFAFQPWQSNYLELYSFDPIKGLYLKNKEFPILGCRQFCTFLFPCLFVPSKMIVLSKNGYNLNLIRLKLNSSNYDGKLEQAIDFDFPNNWQGNIFGTMSQTGEYLITWDSKSKQIQIRQYKEVEQTISTKNLKTNCQIY